jgi:hypothetical protein
MAASSSAFCVAALSEITFLLVVGPAFAKLISANDTSAVIITNFVAFMVISCFLI